MASASKTRMAGKTGGGLSGGCIVAEVAEDIGVAHRKPIENHGK